MMRQSLAGGTVVVCSFIVVVLALQPFKPKRGVGLVDFKRLQPGMTQAEVERLLGGRPRNALGYRAIIWLPQAGGKPISAEIAPVSPAVEWFVREDRPQDSPPPKRASALDFFPEATTKDGDQALWITSAGLIAVSFGPDARLRDKYHSTVHELATPSVFDWLASRPKMIGRSLGLSR